MGNASTPKAAARAKSDTKAEAKGEAKALAPAGTDQTPADDGAAAPEAAGAPSGGVAIDGAAAGGEPPIAATLVDPGGILVSCPSGARRRAGFAFGPVETHVPAAELTEEVAAAIAADPLLVVRRYRSEADAASA